MNTETNLSRQIPLETDFSSQNHEAFANAVCQCKSGDPTACIRNEKCSLNGECFDYKPTELSEADAIIKE